MLPSKTKTKMATKIFFFETSPGTHTIVGAATVEEARSTIGERSAYCTLIGWTPADELCIITGTFVPSVLLPVEDVTPMTIEEAVAFWKRVPLKAFPERP